MENRNDVSEHSASTDCYSSLVNRLRGIYTMPITDGAGPLNGSDTFTRTFEGLPPINAEAANAIERLLAMLSEFAGYGEELWDSEDFRDGYKKISSGKLVDCRVLLRQFGITQFDE